jgi:hypothetical protein
MGGSSASVTVPQSSKGIVNIFETASALQGKAKKVSDIPEPYRPLYNQLSDHTSAFVIFNGELLPW